MSEATGVMGAGMMKERKPATSAETREAHTEAKSTTDTEKREAHLEAKSTTGAEQRETHTEAESTAGMKRKKKSRRRLIRRIIWTVVILAVLGVVGWVVYSKLRADYQVTYDPYTASVGTISNSLNFTGSMQLVNSKTYTASGDQKVKEVYVNAGDKVEKGDKLIRLSGGDTLTADFSGTVSTVDVAKGDEVASGATLMTLADFDHMRVSVRIGESDIGSVAVGQSCRVAVSSADANFEETIDKIDYSTYSGNNVAYYTATIYVDTAATKNIYPGMQATVTVPQEEANNVIVLKMDALSTARDNTAYVYKQAEDGSMVETPVTVGVSNGNYVEIKEGLSDGETVYKVAEKTQESGGLASLFSSMFGSQQVNRPSGMPSGFGSGSGGFSFPGGSGGDGSSRPSRTQNSNGQGGGSRGN